LDWIGSVYTKGTENQSNPFKIAVFYGFWFDSVLVFRFGYCGLHWIGLDMNTPNTYYSKIQFISFFFW